MYTRFHARFHAIKRSLRSLVTITLPYALKSTPDEYLRLTTPAPLLLPAPQAPAA